MNIIADDIIWRDVIMSIVDTFDRYGEEIIKAKIIFKR